MRLQRSELFLHVILTCIEDSEPALVERNIYYVDHGDTFSSVQLAHMIIPSHSCDNHFVGVAVKLFP